MAGDSTSKALLPFVAYLALALDSNSRCTRFTARHGFEKPNDVRALNLMNAAATAVITDLPDVVFGYGVSDEFSFVLRKDCQLFERRERYAVFSQYRLPSNPMNPPYDYCFIPLEMP